MIKTIFIVLGIIVLLLCSFAGLMMCIFSSQLSQEEEEQEKEIEKLMKHHTDNELDK